MFFAGSVLGYRSWRMGSGHYQLQGRLTLDRWPHNEPLEAGCRPPRIASLARKAEEHDVPDYDCLCGIYAYKSEDEMWRRSVVSVKSVFGAILAWGRIVEHAHGFRSQYAKPIAFVQRTYPNYDWDQLLEQIADLYGVPVLDPSDLSDYASDFGLPLSDFASI